MSLHQTEPPFSSPPSFDDIPLYPGWKQSAVIGTIAGMLSVTAAEAVTKIDVESYLKSQKLVNICNKRKQSRFARLARSFRLGGLRGGVCTVAFTGVLSCLSENRGVVDLHNFAAAGLVEGGALGLMVPPLFSPRIRHGRVLSVMALSVMFGVISYPFGWAYLKGVETQRVYFDDLLKQIKEEESEHYAEARMKDEEAI